MTHVGSAGLLIPGLLGAVAMFVTQFEITITLKRRPRH
jgi:hypothetical protein